MQPCLRAVRRAYSSALPWFVDEAPALPARARPAPAVPDVPANTPAVIRLLHTQLAQSPHLEPSKLLVSESIARPPGPALPFRAPQGRRKRGGTYAGESAYDVPGGIWNWVVIAQAWSFLLFGALADTRQVKEGTEDKGAIESVVRVVRKTLLSTEPPLALPPNSKRTHNGWALIDAGDFAVHILSREAREKYWSVVDHVA
ncbi:hypothetical protein C0993_011548 [Termitomyces sp. T159_Od127]|nr:hypothetical protein C0993_011548 [Termitomyces sp. T159_Od127]